jgi:uncharacterized membrane protein YfcA
MLDATTLFIAAVFVAAGLTKGVIGLGLPTISMGLLALVMPPVQAAALLALPSLVTNVWQMAAGPWLRTVALRLWPMMAGVCAGTWAGMGLMNGAGLRYGTMLLGVALAIYALTGLAARRFTIARAHEVWAGPLVGAVTGLITAATGVFVIPAVPYLQAIGLEKEELVQALGLSFTVSTAALAVNLARADALNASLAGPALGALAMAAVGMGLGQALRLRMSPPTFRRWFFIALLLLGLYLATRGLA